MTFIKTTFYILMCCIMVPFSSCDKKVTDKKDIAEGIPLDTKLELIKSTELINVTVIDTTNYLINCAYKNLTHGEASFQSIENYLLEQNILKSKTQQGYKEFSVNYVMGAKFPLSKIIPIHNGEKIYFQNKLKIGNIIKQNIANSDAFYAEMEVCFKSQFEKEGFEKSSIKTLGDTYNWVFEVMTTGVIEEKYKNATAVEILNDKIQSTLFNNRDTKLMNYLLLYNDLKDYDEAQMEADYQNALEASEDLIEETSTKEVSTKEELEKSKDDPLEIVVMSEEEEKEFIKNGGTIEEIEIEEPEQ